MSAAELYERIRAACCEHHGFATEWEFEDHVKGICVMVLKARGLA